MASYAASLLSNASASGTAVKWPGGMGVFIVVGAFDSESVTLQMLGPDGSTYTDLSYGGETVSLSAAGAIPFVAPAGEIKAVVSAGGGSPSGLYAKAVSV